MGADAILRSAILQDAAQILDLEEAGMRTFAETLWGNWKPTGMPATLVLDGCGMIVFFGHGQTLPVAMDSKAAGVD